MLNRPLIILDRDGVLNEMVIDAEHGTIDSPLHPSQVVVLPWVPEALDRLRRAGFDLAVATNQPAAAKGKTTRANLEAVHRKVLELAQARDLLATSHICYHRSEDECACRKPRTGLLDEALEDRSPSARQHSWMVGDGITDIEAGLAAGLHTAFLAPPKCSACRVLEDAQLAPSFWGTTLMEFTHFIVSRT
jgi:D-glycero-D-manno-heptose 1,7-bisphosphate phosphatase